MITEKLTRDEIKKIRSNPMASQNRREYWTEKEDKELTKKFAEGTGITEMAFDLKRTERSIIQRIQILKLFQSVNQKKAAPEKDGCLCKECRIQKECAHKGSIGCEKI